MKIQLFLKCGLANDTYFIEIKQNKLVNQIIIFSFDNNYRKNFERSNYSLVGSGSWVNEDIFLIKNDRNDIYFIYRVSSNELTTAFSPINDNKYKFIKNWFIESSFQKFVEVIIDKDFTEVKRIK